MVCVVAMQPLGNVGAAHMTMSTKSAQLDHKRRSQYLQLRNIESTHGTRVHLMSSDSKMETP